MKYRITISLIFSFATQCSHAQITTTLKPDEPAISRNIIPNVNFGILNVPTTTKAPTTTTTPEKTCPPDDRWESPRSDSFIECLCKEEANDQQPCVLRIGGLFGMYERMVVPALLPRISATDLGFLYLWSNQGFQCHPFMGIGGLSIACYHEIGSFPMSRDCRFSRARYFCEMLICIDGILGNPRIRPTDFLECIRRIPVPMTTQAPTWQKARPTRPSRLPPPTPALTQQPTTTSGSGMMASQHLDTHDHDDHSGHDHSKLDAEHFKMDTIKVVSGVVGGILGGFFLTAVIFMMCWLYKRKRQEPSDSQPRAKMSVKKQESAVYAEVGDTGSDTGLVNSAYLSNHAPDVISTAGTKGQADDHDKSSLNNDKRFSSFGNSRGKLGRQLSIESNQYCTIDDSDTLSKRSSRSSVYNKLREDGKSVVCDHVYNRAEFKVQQEQRRSDAYDRVTTKQNNCDNPQKTIMKKHPSTGSLKKRVYFTLEPSEFMRRDDEDF